MGAHQQQILKVLGAVTKMVKTGEYHLPDEAKGALLNKWKGRRTAATTPMPMLAPTPALAPTSTPTLLPRMLPLPPLPDASVAGSERQPALTLHFTIVHHI